MADETRSEDQPSPLDAIIRLAGMLMGAFGVVGYLFWLLSGGLVREGNWIGIDFHVYYEAAQVLRRGADIYTAGISPPYVYPPLLAALVVPLSLLSVSAATIIWKLSQHIFLLAAGVLLLRMLPSRVRPLVGGFLLLGLLTAPLQDEIQVGESNSLILFLEVTALLLVLRTSQPSGAAAPAQRPFLDSMLTPAVMGAGLLLALAASIKVLPVLLVAYFWWRGPRPVAAVATGGFLLLQLVMFVLTPSTADYWFVQFPGLFGQAFPYLDNQSINAFLARALTPSGDPSAIATQVADGEALRPVLTWLANLLVIAATAAVVWRARPNGNGQDESARAVRLLLEVGLVLLTIHMVSGSTWLHHLVDLVVPIAGLLGVWWLAQGRTIQGDASGLRPAILAVGLGGGLGLLLHRPGDWVTAANAVFPLNPLLALLASSTGLWVVLALWSALALVLLRYRNAS